MNLEGIEYVVLDLETNTLNKTGIGFAASPHHIDNNIVLGGLLYENGAIQLFDPVSSLTGWSGNPFNYEMWVGHNIKFDLMYMRKHWPIEYDDWIKNGGVVWDTMVVEYLLSGQSEKMPSLDKLSNVYGGTQKNEGIKQYWNEGIDTADIPKKELEEYLVEDLRNTAIVFEHQIQPVIDKGMLPLVTTQMEALLALAEMEYLGIKVDKKGMYNAGIKKRTILDAKEKWLTDIMKQRLPSHIDTEVTPASSQQVSAVLFGGEVGVVIERPVVDGDGKPVVYKSGKRKGQIRTKKSKEKVEVLPFPETYRHRPSAKGKNGFYSTDDTTLNNILTVLRTSAKGPVKFLTELLAYRAITKDLTVYYTGYLKTLWPGDYIHANFNQALTSTGRLSCNNPNLHAVSKKSGEDDE